MSTTSTTGTGSANGVGAEEQGAAGAAGNCDRRACGCRQEHLGGTPRAEVRVSESGDGSDVSGAGVESDGARP